MGISQHLFLLSWCQAAAVPLPAACPTFDSPALCSLVADLCLIFPLFFHSEEQNSDNP